MFGDCGFQRADAFKFNHLGTGAKAAQHGGNRVAHQGVVVNNIQAHSGSTFVKGVPVTIDFGTQSSNEDILRHLGVTLLAENKPYFGL